MLILANVNAFVIWFTILVNSLSKFVYDNPNENAREFVWKSLWMIIENLYEAHYEWSLWAGIIILVNNPYEWIPLSSYDNLGEECSRIGTTIVSWYLTQDFSSIIEASIFSCYVSPMKWIDTDVSSSAKNHICIKCKCIIMHLHFITHVHYNTLMLWIFNGGLLVL